MPTSFGRATWMKATHAHSTARHCVPCTVRIQGCRKSAKILWRHKNKKFNYIRSHGNLSSTPETRRAVMLHYYAGENQLKKLRHELHLDESKVGVVGQWADARPCGRPGMYR